MTKKILYLVQPASFFESHRLHIALAAMDQGYEIHVVTNGDLDTITRLKNQGLYVQDLEIPRDKNGVWKEVLSLWRIIKNYRKIRPDICHHVTMRMIVFGMIASRVFPPRKIINAYSGLGFLFTQNSSKTKIARLVIKFIMVICKQPKKQHAIFQNDDDKREILHNNFEITVNSHLIRGSGVDISHFKNIAEPTDGPIKIVFPARLLKDKGIFEFVEAIKIVKQTQPDIYVQLAGTPDHGNPTSITGELLDQWLNEGIINQHGFVNDMFELYQSSHIVCLPSYREGLPKSLLEASACGRPIVTTDVPGCRELHNKEAPYSIIVPDRNIAALASALIELINSSEKRLAYGANGRLESENYFCKKIVCQKTLDLY